ncbi:MAG: YbaY family lipoprotein [Gammaproteobacteria bacterium]
MRKPLFLLASFTITAGLLSSCGQPAPDEAETGSVTGTVSYRERMALSPEAVVSVKLLDVSLADVPSQTLGEQIINNPGNVPIAFSIDYDPEVISEKNSYAVRAEIRDRGQLLFTTDTHYPVLTREARNNTDLILVRVAAPSKPAVETTVDATEPPASPGEIAGAQWSLTELNGAAVSTDAENPAPNFMVDTEAAQIGGFAGCNNFSGSFEATDGRVNIGPMAVTMMACADDNGAETTFLQMMEKFNRYEVVDGTLSAFHDEELLARFESAFGG